MVKKEHLTGNLKNTYLINLIYLAVTKPIKIHFCFLNKNIFITLKAHEDLPKLNVIFT